MQVKAINFSITRRTAFIWIMSILAIVWIAFAVAHFSPQIIALSDMPPPPVQMAQLGRTTHGPRNTTLNFKTGVFTQFYTDDYFEGILTLAHSVRKIHPNVDFNIMYFEGRVSQMYLDAFQALGYRMRAVERLAPAIKPEYFRYKDQFTKLRIWTYTEYERIVYIDSDCVVIGDLGTMFNLPLDIHMAAVGDIWNYPNGFDKTFNAGVLAITPSMKTFQLLLDTVDKTDRYNTRMAEQALLNYVFEFSFLRLPYIFNMNLAMYEATRWSYLRDVWNSLYADARIIHYTVGKPFHDSDMPQFKDPFDVYFKLHDEARENLREIGIDVPVPEVLTA